MFSKKSLPISIALILLIALSTLGLAYGFWTETLQINGTVDTGDLDVAFVDPGLAVTEYDPGNVGTCAYTISSDGNSIEVTIAGAYPWYECTVPVKMQNVGSVPVTYSGPVAVSAPAWIGLSPISLSSSPLPAGGSVAFTLNIFVDETAPEGYNDATFHLEFDFEQVH